MSEASDIDERVDPYDIKSGIWNLRVGAVDDDGNSAVGAGDHVYLHSMTHQLSKVQHARTQIPYGYALGTVPAGATDLVAVSVHFDYWSRLRVAQGEYES